MASDGVFIGPADLHASMGYTGEINNPVVVPIIEEAMRRIRKCGKAPGVLAFAEPDIRRYSPPARSSPRSARMPASWRAARKRSAPSTRAETRRRRGRPPPVPHRRIFRKLDGREHRQGRDPSRAAGRSLRSLARLLHRRPRRRAPLSRLFDPRPRHALDVRGDLLPSAVRRIADARRARALRRRAEVGARASGGILDIIRTVRAAHPMDVLRTAVSALAAFDPDVGDLSAQATLRKGVRLTAQVPMIIAAHEAIRHDREPPSPIRALRTPPTSST
jgi:hypothetical protein